MQKDRPLAFRNTVDPRIVPSSKENVVLKCVRFVQRVQMTCRFVDILAVQYAMKYLMHVRNKVHYYNVSTFMEVLNRPKDVGLLTVCNHVTVLDSASIVPSIIPLGSRPRSHSLLAQLMRSRNCGYWNLGAEEIMFDSKPKAWISSLVKVRFTDCS